MLRQGLPGYTSTETDRRWEVGVNKVLKEELEEKATLYY